MADMAGRIRIDRHAELLRQLSAEMASDWRNWEKVGPQRWQPGSAVNHDYPANVGSDVPIAIARYLASFADRRYRSIRCIATGPPGEGWIPVPLPPPVASHQTFSAGSPAREKLQ